MGFTLIEVMMTIAVLGILAVVAIPNLANSSDPYEVVGEAREIHSQLVEARARAVAEQRPYRISFNAGTFYRMDYESGGVWYTVGAPDTLVSGTSLSVDGVSGGEVVFESHGRPTSVATIVVDNGVHDEEIRILASGMAVWDPTP